MKAILLSAGSYKHIQGVNFPVEVEVCKQNEIIGRIEVSWSELNRIAGRQLYGECKTEGIGFYRNWGGKDDEWTEVNPFTFWNRIKSPREVGAL